MKWNKKRSWQTTISEFNPSHNLLWHAVCLHLLLFITSDLNVSTSVAMIDNLAKSTRRCDRSRVLAIDEVAIGPSSITKQTISESVSAPLSRFFILYAYHLRFVFDFRPSLGVYLIQNLAHRARHSRFEAWKHRRRFNNYLRHNSSVYHVWVPQLLFLCFSFGCNEAVRQWTQARPAVVRYGLRSVVVKPSAKEQLQPQRQTKRRAETFDAYAAQHAVKLHAQ